MLELLFLTSETKDTERNTVGNQFHEHGTKEALKKRQIRSKETETMPKSGAFRDRPIRKQPKK